MMQKAAMKKDFKKMFKVLSVGIMSIFMFFVIFRGAEAKKSNKKQNVANVTCTSEGFLAPGIPDGYYRIIDGEIEEYVPYRYDWEGKVKGPAVDMNKVNKAPIENFPDGIYRIYKGKIRDYKEAVWDGFEHYGETIFTVAG